jgi:hypothetical protein
VGDIAVVGGDSSRARRVLTGLGGVALGYALGVLSATPRTSAPETTPSSPVSVAAVVTVSSPDASAGASTGVASDGTAAPSTEVAALPQERPRGPDPQETVARIGSLDDELAGLAKALTQPQSYSSARAVLDDLAAYETARTRRDSLARSLPDERRSSLPPVPELRAGLRERARAIERAGALGLAVRGVPQDVTYLPVSAPSPDGRGSELTTFAGVALGVEPAGPRIVFRTLKGDVERRVSVLEDAKSAHDVLRVEYAERDGPVRVSRLSQLGPIGQTWRSFSERLWTRGFVEHDELEQLVGGPLAHPPRPGWIDWLRKHVDLPRNRDLGEEFGPAPPLPRTNPLLLSNARARPAVLERGDLVVDPERAEPPVVLTGRGPFVLLAANAVGVYDSAWRWLVFDAAMRRVVDHAELAAGEVEHVRWDFLPEPERFPQARRGDLIDALLATALERTRQALALLSLPAEVAAMGQELRAKVGGVVSQDGLEALRLRNEILDRMRRLDAIGHLLLDDDGVTHYEMAHDRAKLETTSEVVEVIARMIEDGHEGPAEFLLRDDRVKSLLFHTPATKSDRDRLRKLFRAKFRPWSVRVRHSLAGLPTQWYEEDGN